MTDAGLFWLVPCDTSGTGCPALVIIDLTNCFNIVQLLLLGINSLKKIIFPKMKHVMEGLYASSGIGLDRESPFCLEDLYCTDYEDPRYEENPACWISGPVKIMHIPHMFPNITLIDMMLRDAEVQNLVRVTNLVHLEIDFSDEPGPGLQTLLDNHPNISRLGFLFLQLGTISQSHLLSIAKNCTKLSYLHINGFHVGSFSGLSPNVNYFHSLVELHLSFWGSGEIDDTDDDDEEAQVVRHSPENITFFMVSAINLQVVSIYCNCDRFVTDEFLHEIFYQNSLTHLTSLSLSGYKPLKLTLDTVKWVVESLPKLTRIHVSKWSIGRKELETLREVVKIQNQN